MQWCDSLMMDCDFFSMFKHVSFISILGNVIQTTWVKNIELILSYHSSVGNTVY